MPTFYTGGNFAPFVPRQVQMLPFDLLRSTLVTRSPEDIQAALEVERAGDERRLLVPQRMAFVRWHDTSGYGENVASMHAALQGEQDKRAEIQRAVRQTPMNDIHQASHADGRNAMPRLSNELDPNLLNVPVSRGIIPWNHLVEPAQIHTAQAPATRVIDHATDAAVAAATAPARLGGIGCGPDHLGDAADTLAPVETPWLGAVLSLLGGAAVGAAIGLPTVAGRDRQWGGAVGGTLGIMIYTVSRIGKRGS